MPDDWPVDLTVLAERVVEECMSELPPKIREIVRNLPVFLCEKIPDHLTSAGLEEDTLGLFEGEDSGEEKEAGQATVYLFLENLWIHSGGDPEKYLDEVRTTLLHEWGHLLGFSEDDLTERGLR